MVAHHGRIVPANARLMFIVLAIVAVGLLFIWTPIGRAGGANSGPPQHSQRVEELLRGLQEQVKSLKVDVRRNEQHLEELRQSEHRTHLEQEGRTRPQKESVEQEDHTKLAVPLALESEQSQQQDLSRRSSGGEHAVSSSVDEMRDLQEQVKYLETVVRQIQLNRRPGERIDWRQFEGNYTPDVVGGKLANIRDTEQPYYPEWCSRFCEGPGRHRKQWEFVQMLRAVDHFVKLEPGKKGLGIAVGQEPLASYFASKGCDIVATDFPRNESAEPGISVKWVDGDQHSASLKQSHRSCILRWEDYKKRGTFRPVDMTKIPEDLLQGQFDFVWSSSSIEHVSSLELSIKAVVDLMEVLKPGGVAVHTTEFSLMPPDQIHDSPGMTIWRKAEVEELSRQLNATGDRLLPVNYVLLRDRPEDMVVDLKPYHSVPHYKLSHPGRHMDADYIHTSIMFIAVRGANKAAAVDRTKAFEPTTTEILRKRRTRRLDLE